MAPQQVEIHYPVGVAGENELSGIATLGNVMGYGDNDDASQASHISQSGRKRPVCPRVYVRLLDHLATFHNEGHLLHVFDVGEGVAIDGNDIGELSSFEAADLVR